jgi:cardiolipin synthase
LLRQIPNLLTLSRLILVPVVLHAIWVQNFGWALLWCAVAGATDALDGFLARRLQARSRIGAYMDPVADKLLLSGSYLVFGLKGIIPLWITAIVFGRDLLILAFAGFAFLLTSSRDFPPTIWGKLSTIVQIGAVLTVLVSGLLNWGRPLVSFALACVVLATSWSAIHYSFLAVRMIRSTRAPGAN